MKGWRLVLAASVLGASLGVPRPAHAEYGEDAGWGALTVLANVLYMPVKVTYAVLGGVTGGLAFVCTAGDFETAQSVWQMSLGGTYVLTPGMIRGEDRILFAGESSSNESQTTTSDDPESRRTHELHEQALPAS